MNFEQEIQQGIEAISQGETFKEQAHQFMVASVTPKYSYNFSWLGYFWSRGNNPKTAVWQYLKNHDEFMIDDTLHNKLLITVAPDGYLKRER